MAMIPVEESEYNLMQMKAVAFDVCANSTRKVEYEPTDVAVIVKAMDELVTKWSGGGEE